MHDCPKETEGKSDTLIRKERGNYFTIKHIHSHPQTTERERDGGDRKKDRRKERERCLNETHNCVIFCCHVKCICAHPQTRGGGGETERKRDVLKQNVIVV